MKKIGLLLLLLSLFSCNDKREILLPKVNQTVVADVQNHSPVYMFFDIKEKDTIIDVNRKGTISSTNWIFNIDKRLPLRLVFPEIIKLQAKKETSMHKDIMAQNYFSYANNLKKTMAFFPFTNVKYIIGKPKNGVIVYFKKNNQILVNGINVKKDSLEAHLNKFPDNQYHNINFCFDKNDNFGNYLNNLNVIRNLEIEYLKPEQFVY
jgi:hypothetical protein